jgi:DNA invertase Pin-like site-specific DNA recombinase
MTRATRHDADAVAIYARYSTDRQDARSIDDQVRRCRAFAESRGLDVAGVFKDATESGAHLERADLQRLLTEARSPRCRFHTVLVDDLSRLSRDLGNTWQIVFRDLATAHVRVIDVSTGMASDSAGARIQFGALALVNDTMLQIVRSETLRGLEGRALAGFRDRPEAGERVAVPHPRADHARPGERSQRNAALRGTRGPEYESGRPLGRPGVR